VDSSCDIGHGRCDVIPKGVWNGEGMKDAVLVRVLLAFRPGAMVSFGESARKTAEASASGMRHRGPGQAGWAKFPNLGK
jgi:hypothetical protein